jgi:hypothetical protein
VRPALQKLDASAVQRPAQAEDGLGVGLLGA